MRYFGVVFFLFLIGLAIPVFANEPKPVWINVLDYGIFDANDDVITNELVVGQEYKIKTQLESEIDIPVTFSYSIQIIDKNKHHAEIVEEFKAESILQTGDVHHTSFGFIPQYAGSFRTLAVFTNVMDGTTIGAVPQYDFEVVSHITTEKKPETETISDKMSDNQSTNRDSIPNGDVDYPVPTEYVLSPPLKQFKSGITSMDIQCKDDLQLILKTSDDSPACVTSVTKQHLMDRGWAKSKSIEEIKHNYESIRQNIIRIEDGRISLYPENTCASIDLQLLSEHDMQQYQNNERELDKSNTLQITDADLDEIPIVEELIYAMQFTEFPYNDSSHVYFEGIDFVEYEFFLMDKMIDKYGGAQKDYFMKLDADYEERLTNPKLQGFSNEFLAPQIVYDGKIYSIGGTVFWTSDESKLSMSVHLKDSVDETQKSVTLTEEDMKSIPKIRDAIENIGTIKESIYAHKGLPEEQWNEYREWFEQKSQERLNADDFRLMQYDERFYSVAFGIC